MKTVAVLPEAFQKFVHLATSTFETLGADALSQIIGEFEALRDVAAQNVTDIIAAELDSLRLSPYTSSQGWDTNQLLLEVNKFYSMGISILHASPMHLLNCVGDSVYIILGTVPLNYTMYEVPSSCNREVFDENALPVFSGKKTAYPGDVLRLKAGRDVIDWEVQESVVLLRFICAPTETIQWTYHKDPVRPWFLAAVDPAATQISALCAYFSAAKYVPSVAPMKALLQHRNHQVRWEATKSLWKIDSSAGIEALKISINDPHPHVRNAAVKTWTRLIQLNGIEGA